MTVAAKVGWDPDSFLRWVESQERRYELSQGSVEEVIGVTRAHARIAMRFAVQLSGRLDLTRFDVTSADFGIVIGNSVRFPDVLVDEMGASARDTRATSPVLAVEVLSPSSVYLDLNIKLSEYRAIPSLFAYVVASQDEPRLWIWQRGQEGWPEAPEVLEGEDAVLSIEELDVEIVLGGIYAGISR